MDLIGKAKRAHIYVSEGDKVSHLPAAMAIVEYLRRENAQGATAIRGVSGFGSTGQVHVPHLVDVRDLPIIIEWIDAPEVVERLLPRVKDMVPRGLITMDETEIVLHQPHPSAEVTSITRTRRSARSWRSCCARLTGPSQCSRTVSRSASSPTATLCTKAD